MNSSLTSGMTGMKLYLASANPGKLREFREAARARGTVVEPVPGMQDLPACVEDGATFAANASKKALYYSAATNGLVFADDSGICVDALGGTPGIHSARFAGPQADDDANNRKLLAELHRVETPKAAGPTLTTNRAAHYLCVIALAESGRLITTIEGRVDGVILDTPRGSGGFGYDPYFFYPPFGKTFAEVTAELKFTVSHRGAAFRQLLDYLQAARPCAREDAAPPGGKRL